MNRRPPHATWIACLCALGLGLGCGDADPAGHEAGDAAAGDAAAGDASALPPYREPEPADLQGNPAVGGDLLRAEGYVPLGSTRELLESFPEQLDACAARSSAEPEDSVYYVAVNEPGADNQACDGRAPSDEGDGHCPFRDFLDPRVRELLVGVKSVRVEVREGLYRFIPAAAVAGVTEEMPFAAEGLRLEGAGTSAKERVSLVAYPGERVVFDGEGHVRELIRLNGRFTRVEGLTLVNAGGYNLEVNGGSEHEVRCNQIGWSGSDSLKGDGNAGTTRIADNEFVDYSSQAIDMTEIHGWVVDGNVMHHPRLADANATGNKLGCSGVRIVGNRIHHSRGLSMGGTSSAHDYPQEATDIVAERNHFEAIAGPVAKLYSCVSCGFIDNVIVDAEAGLMWEDQERAGPSGCPGGCAPSRDTRVEGNRFRDVNATEGEGAMPNLFMMMLPSEAVGLRAASNLYCTLPEGPARFWLNDFLDLAGWQAATGTDADSRVVPSSDADCEF